MTDVIVLGGGLAGCATALDLARAGMAVTLVEAGVPGGQASSANAGSLHAQIPHDPFRHKGADWARAWRPAVSLLIESIGLWRTLEADLAADLEIGFGGGLLVATSDAEMAEIAAKAQIERDAGLAVELLGRDTIRARAPYLAETAIGGAFAPIEGKANPLLVVPALLRAARAAGVAVASGVGEARITATGTGYRVVAGDRHWQARRIVIAAGAATGALAAQLGTPLAIDAVPIQVSVTEPAAPLVPHLLYCAGQKLTLKQARNGSLLIGGGWDARLDEGGRPQVDAANLAANLRVAMAMVPAIAGLNIVRSWAAHVNGTDDWLPIIGPLPGHPDALVCFVPWVGFTGSPAAARLVADMLLGRPPAFDLPMAAFAPNAAGSPS
ncbi:MAG: FAD-binding oxidoreductase [Alphaproteobacteria bacterium]|nr:FAD-binding oxidoreductase [Alphaproteobacteria bacterium]